MSLIDEPGTTAVPTKRGIEDAITAMIRRHFTLFFRWSWDVTQIRPYWEAGAQHYHLRGKYHEP